MSLKWFVTPRRICYWRDCWNICLLGRYSVVSFSTPPAVSEGKRIDECFNFGSSWKPLVGMYSIVNWFLEGKSPAHQVQKHQDMTLQLARTATCRKKEQINVWICKGNNYPSLSSTVGCWYPCCPNASKLANHGLSFLAKRYYILTCSRKKVRFRSPCIYL